MTVDTTPPSPPGSKQRGTKIRRFVKRVTSFANIRPNGRDAKGATDPKASDLVPDHPSPPSPSHSGPHVAHDDTPGNTLHLPPSLVQSISTSSSATATIRSQQPTFLSPRRDDDANSIRSGDVSDSQESSFSGLSAFPSDYGHSATASPEKARGLLLDSSLNHRLSSPAPPEYTSDVGARVDSSVISALDELTRVLNGHRVSVTSEHGVEQAAPQFEEHDSNNADQTPVAQQPAGNSLLLNATPPAEEDIPGHAMDDIPVLESLTQLNSEFGASSSSSIVCQVEDQPEVLEAPEAAMSSAVADHQMLSEDLASSPDSSSQYLSLPLEPTLPAIPEISSGADPDFLDLDTPAEGDVYAVGQTDLVSDAVTDEPTTEKAVAESFALALPLESTPTDAGAVDALNVVESPPVLHEDISPFAKVEDTTRSPDILPCLDERPVIEACPPAALDAIVREEFPSLTSSEMSIAGDETSIEDVSLPETESAMERPVIEACPPAEVEAHIVKELPYWTPSEMSIAVDEALVEDGSLLPESENLMERPVIEACPPAEVEAIIIKDIPSSTPSEFSVPIDSEETLLEDNSVEMIENVLERPVIEPCPSVETEAVIRAEIPSFTPSEGSVSLRDASVEDVNGALEVENERPVIDACLPAEQEGVLQDIIQDEIPSATPSENFAAVEGTTKNATERPVIEPCPPAEIDALISVEIPSITVSSASSEAASLLEDPRVLSENASESKSEDAIGLVEESSGAISPDEIESNIAAETVTSSELSELSEASCGAPTVVDDPEGEHAVTVHPADAFSQLIGETAAPAVSEILPEHANNDEANEECTPRSVEEAAQIDAAVINTATDHVEERPVLERYPTAEDDQVIASIAQALPPADDSEFADLETALLPSTDTNFDGSGPEPDGSASNDHNETADLSGAEQEYDMPVPANDASDNVESNNHESTSPSADVEAAPVEPADTHDPQPEDVSAPRPNLSVEKDLPELIPSIPTSSNSSEYGDELEDPPYPTTLIVPQGPKHLPLVTRTVHLSLCYSLTWWLSKNPMF